MVTIRIVIESIPQKLHRYPTAGDYWRDADGTLQIRVSEMADVRDMVLVGLHELIEATLCNYHGISEEAIMSFDMAHLGDDDPYVDDPGLSPDAPYHREHVFAEAIERLVARELGRNWQEYEIALSNL